MLTRKPVPRQMERNSTLPRWSRHRSDNPVFYVRSMPMRAHQPYKVPAHSADAKKFAGEGDESFAASEGKERSGVIDPDKMPEIPITKTASTDPVVAPIAATPRVVASVAKPGAPFAKAATAPAPAAKGGSAMIQLGAYDSEALAKSSWSRLAKRFDYLSALSYSIQPVTVNGGQFYRLRVATPQANILCGKLKVAGESCMVVN
jgi:hypothetical protein